MKHEITVDYTVTDASGETGSSSFIINLTGTNDIPVIDVIGDVNTAEDSTQLSGQLTATDADANEPSTISSLALPSLA